MDDLISAMKTVTITDNYATTILSLIRGTLSLESWEVYKNCALTILQSSHNAYICSFVLQDLIKDNAVAVLFHNDMAIMLFDHEKDDDNNLPFIEHGRVNCVGDVVLTQYNDIIKRYPPALPTTVDCEDAIAFLVGDAVPSEKTQDEIDNLVQTLNSTTL
ncbi:hypothetical protein P280DRAFT_523141 [Massarina eburnea CBS 473.64]|uniref:Uncharacterized protein n=1 Tax=Massarina eburnea CBS 473.64 TaxID=1395130 RepID=A0A6A6RJZ4_9PLEO|nr:hypothetical protein P280DRAFT_523141 [Massarina eburnea CBS 473.64]